MRYCYAGISEQELPPWLHIVSTVLQIVSFIIINFVFMKLYTHRGAQIKVMPFLILIGLTFVIALGQSLFMEPSSETVMPGDNTVSLLSISIP